MKGFHDLTGRQFGFLRVAAHVGVHRGRRYWKVECLCGRPKVVLAANLLSGRSTSCGCVARAKASARMTVFMLAEKSAAMRDKGMTSKAIMAELGRAYDSSVRAKQKRQESCD
jgi:hypothetical protein